MEFVREEFKKKSLWSKFFKNSTTYFNEKSRILDGVNLEYFESMDISYKYGKSKTSQTDLNTVPDQSESSCIKLIQFQIQFSFYFSQFRKMFNEIVLLSHYIQLREYQKDLEYRLHLSLSKFDKSVFLIFLAFIWLSFFLSRNYWSSLDHDLICQHLRKKPFQFWRKF